MITKDEVQAIKIEIGQIIEVIKILEIKKEEKATALLNAVLSCEEILNQAPWNLTDNEMVLQSRINRHRILSDFLQTDYHCNFSTENLNLYFNDDDVDLCFYSPTKLLEFVAKFKVRINIKILENQKERLLKNISEQQEALKDVEKAIEHVKEINALPETTSET